MSHLGRRLVTFGLSMLVVGSGAGIRVAEARQVGAVKDAWLVMKVHSEMVDEAVLNGSNIDVDVKDGVVTLRGTVPSAAARARALEVARKNDGVKNVVDQLRVGPTATGGTAGAMDRAGDKMERAGEKAVDKGDSATRRAGRAIDDGWIKSKIYAQYMADWNTVLDDSDIDVDVDNNVVTLSGTVKSAEAKTKAVATARATDGVKSVRDMLKVAAR
jgi:hyperosmotically inducible periplasmic protein